MIGNARPPADLPPLPRSCSYSDGTPKAVFRTEHDALRARRKHKKRGELHAYYCERCIGFHLGHTR